MNLVYGNKQPKRHLPNKTERQVISKLFSSRANFLTSASVQWKTASKCNQSLAYKSCTASRCQLFPLCNDLFQFSGNLLSPFLVWTTTEFVYEWAAAFTTFLQIWLFAVNLKYTVYSLDIASNINVFQNIPLYFYLVFFLEAAVFFLYLLHWIQVIHFYFLVTLYACNRLLILTRNSDLASAYIYLSPISAVGGGESQI